MKRILSVLLAAAMLLSLLCLSSCSFAKSPFSLQCDTASVAPGSEFTVTIHTDAYKSIACFQFDVFTEGKAQALDGDILSAGEFTVIPSRRDEKINVAGYVARVEDFTDCDFAEVVCKVNDDAVSGDKIVIRLDVSQFMIGLDEDGNKTQELSGKFKDCTLELTVA